MAIGLTGVASSVDDEVAKGILVSIIRGSEERERDNKLVILLHTCSSHLQKSLAEKCESSKNGSTLRYQRPNIDKSEEK